jgi:excisionase family DNA binding protein
MGTQEGRRTYRVEEAGQLLGLGRSATYAAIGRGEIPSIRIGRKILVPRRALEQLLDVPAAGERQLEEAAP